MRKFKKALSLLLIACMIVPMSIAAMLPVTAVQSSDGGGVVAEDGSGVYYRFSNLSWVDAFQTMGISGRVYTTGDGIQIYVYNNRYYFDTDAEGNLVATDNSADPDDYFQMSLLSGYSYPIDFEGQGFFDINALAIRYKILNNDLNKGQTDKFEITSGNSTSATCDFLIPEDEEWVETVYPLKSKGTTLGWWNVDNNLDTNRMEFPKLSPGATIVIDYVGLYHSIEEAKSAHGNFDGVSYKADYTRVIRFTGVEKVDLANWKLHYGMSLQTGSGTRAYTNDADGNLRIQTLAESGLWDPIGIYQAGIGGLGATVLEMRYKTISDATGEATTPAEFTAGTSVATDPNLFTVKSNTELAVKTVTTTGPDKDGWYVSRAIFADGVNTSGHTDSGYLGVIFPGATKGTTYVIDYLGFFGDETTADAHTKRNCVYDADAVKLSGAQAKNNGEHGVRFVGVIDDYANAVYDEFGFKIKVNGATATAKIEKYVYDTIMENGNPISVPENSVSAQGENTKFFTYCVNNIPETACTDGKLTFTVCSYAIIKGLEVCGPTATFVYDYASNTIVAA